MVAVTSGDASTIVVADQRSVSCASDDSTKNNESTTPSMLGHGNKFGSTNNCAETSGTSASDSPLQIGSRDSQLLCAGRRKITRRAQSVEVRSDTNIRSLQDPNSSTTSSSCSTRRKLSKQENVDEQYLDNMAIFTGESEICLIPTTFSGPVLSQKLYRSTSVVFPRERNSVTSVSADRLRFASGSVTSTNTIAVATTMDDGQSNRGIDVTNSVLLGNHSDDDVVPSRTRHLVRSLAMCGDDDTRLRPPPLPVVNSFRSMKSFGFPVQCSQRSSSQSGESSYHDNTLDQTEVEIRSFIAATLHKNPRDRALVLELEQIFTNFVNSFGEQSIKLPPVSSYNRMIIHRVAVLFGLDHNVDNSGKCVVVSKTKRTRTPDFLFASLIRSNVFTDGKRFYPVPWNYNEFGVGELTRRAQSFDTGCILPNVKSDPFQQSHSRSSRNQRSFENQHLPYYITFVNHGPMMKKAGSFSGIPTNYQAGHGFFESYDRSQNVPALLSTQDGTVERFSNLSLSDSTSQISHGSTSNPPTHSGMYPSYPHIMQYPLGEEAMCAQAPYQQQLLVQPTSTVIPSSVEMFPSQPAVMVPVQPHPSIEQAIPVIPYQQQEHLTNNETSQEEITNVMPLHSEYVNYPVQHSFQVGSFSTQSYQPLTHDTFTTQFQQVVSPQHFGHVIQQPVMHAQQQYIQPQHYATPVIQTSTQYHHPAIHQQLQPHHHYMLGHSYLHYPQQSKQAQDGTIALTSRRHYLKRVKAEQPSSHGRVTCGQWSNGEQYRDFVNGGRVCNLDGERSETVMPTPHILSTQLQTGTTLLNPPSAFAHPEPMYHYSQISPVMSSMQQQQILQVQCHSNTYLYKPTQHFSQQTTSIDGGYCSMNQDSIRESDIAITDVQ